MTQEISWPKAALVVAIIIVAVAAGAFVLLRRGGQNTGAAENVAFEYRASFAYLSSADNRPLEDLQLWFSLPQVENQLAGTLYPSWGLYYLENDNTLTLQATALGIENLQGSRTSTLGILHHEVGMGTDSGPTTLWKLDRLYLREVFVEIDQLSVNKNKAGATTARIYNYTGPSYAWGLSENRAVDFSFSAQLFRENVRIESFAWIQENGAPGGYWLWTT